MSIVSNTSQRTIALLHGIAKLALVGFGVGFVGLIIVGVFLDADSPMANVLGIGCLCLTVASGLLHAISMLLRDYALSPPTRLSFSLSTLLFAFTLIALVMGFIVWVGR
jgi:hypothetical protein